MTVALSRDAARRAQERGEIAVYDDRYTENPSFRILRSCDVRSRRVRREALAALLDYDAAHPTEPRWRRTLPSLEREWLLHNLAYRVGFLRSRARDVDLDNHAEGKGALGYFLKSVREVIWGYLKPKQKKHK
ncbi:MAG: hypothetical protein GX417_05120 [Clostridiales bacterium]|nr:hypothetical protein [Clostridiales bacterium]